MENSPSPLSSSPPRTATGSVDTAGTSSKGGNIKNVVTTTTTQDIKTNDHHRRTNVKRGKTPKVTATTTVTTINMSKVNVNHTRKQRSQSVIVTPPQDHCYIKKSTRRRNNQIRKSNSKSPPIAILPKPTVEAPHCAPTVVVVTPPRPRVIVNNKIQHKEPPLQQAQTRQTTQLEPELQIIIPDKVDSPSICISDTEEKEFDNDVQVVEHPYIENCLQLPPAPSPSPLSNLPIKKRRKLSLHEEDPYPYTMRTNTNQISYPSQKLYKMYSIADFMEYDIHNEEPPQPQIQPNYLYSPQSPRYSFQRRQKPYYSPTAYPRYHSPEPVVNVAPSASSQPFIRRSHLPQPIFEEEDFNGVITEEERIHITTLIRCGNYNFTDKVLGNYIMNRRRLQAVDFNLCYNCNDLCGNSSGEGGGGNATNCQCRNRHYNLRNLRDGNNSTAALQPLKVENLKPSPRTMKRSFSTGPGIVTSPRIDLLTNDLRGKPRNYGTTHPKKVTGNKHFPSITMILISFHRTFSITLLIFELTINTFQDFCNKDKVVKTK